MSRNTQTKFKQFGDKGVYFLILIIVFIYQIPALCNLLLKYRYVYYGIFD